MFKRQQIEWNRINQSLVLHLDWDNLYDSFTIRSIYLFHSAFLLFFFLFDEYSVHLIIIILLW